MHAKISKTAQRTEPVKIRTFFPWILRLLPCSRLLLFSHVMCASLRNFLCIEKRFFLSIWCRMNRYSMLISIWCKMNLYSMLRAVLQLCVPWLNLACVAQSLLHLGFAILAMFSNIFARVYFSGLLLWCFYSVLLHVL